MVRLISLIMIIIFSGTNIHAKELDLGSKMPLVKTKMMDISGKSISLSEAKGENGLLVIFSCNTCPWVKRW